MAVTDLAALAREHHAFVPTDSTFQRRARLLQALWRERHGYPVGEHRGLPLGSRLAMPWAEETLTNYLTDGIRAVVRRELAAAQSGQVYSRPRIYNDLLSSQPLCFNLFGELQTDLALATRVLRDLTAGRVWDVTGIEFEWSPGRGDATYTADGSAFDVYVGFRTPAGDPGFIGIEVKYHEDLRDQPAEHRARYDEVAALMGCFREDCRGRLRQKPLQQLWRDHLLAGAVRAVDGLADGIFVLLYPRQNQACDAAARTYRSCLSREDTFMVWMLDDVVAALRTHGAGGWAATLGDRYLGFDRLPPV